MILHLCYYVLTSVGARSRRRPHLQEDDIWDCVNRSIDDVEHFSIFLLFIVFSSFRPYALMFRATSKCTRRWRRFKQKCSPSWWRLVAIELNTAQTLIVCTRSATSRNFSWSNNQRRVKSMITPISHTSDVLMCSPKLFFYSFTSSEILWQPPLLRFFLRLF